MEYTLFLIFVPNTSRPATSKKWVLVFIKRHDTRHKIILQKGVTKCMHRTAPGKTQYRTDRNSRNLPTNSPPIQA